MGNQPFQAGLTEIMRLSKLDRYGLDCYAYAMLAEGYIDAVIEVGLQEYDIRAPEAVVLSSGGIISNFTCEIRIIRITNDFYNSEAIII